MKYSALLRAFTIATMGAPDLILNLGRIYYDGHAMAPEERERCIKAARKFAVDQLAAIDEAIGPAEQLREIEKAAS